MNLRLLTLTAFTILGAALGVDHGEETKLRRLRAPGSVIRYFNQCAVHCIVKAMGASKDPNLSFLILH